MIDLPPLPPSTANARSSNSSGLILPPPSGTGSRQSGLPADLQAEVDRIAMMQSEDERRFGPLGPPRGDAPSPSESPASRLILPRPPSPTEPRPIKAIPIPDDAASLGERTWTPTRKFWAAAATCHGPLYFQDAALERYGQSVEQSLGSVGRWFSYPIDDPTQSNQRRQILQPFASIGLFAFQIATWPITAVLDPPTEPEYDLGYYRPGDRIPPDTVYFPWTGVGPPLRGKHYP